MENKIKLVFVIGLIDDDVHSGFVSTPDDNITMFGELFYGEGKSFSEGLAVGKITLFCGFSTQLGDYVRVNVNRLLVV